METIRDRLWLWGHEAGSHDTGWQIPRPSRITPVEAAAFMGLRNVIMVRYSDKPAPPFDQYFVPFRSLDKVVWSVVGAGGATNDAERAHVLDLARKHPNITGVMMDDFFRNPKDHGGEVAALHLEQLRKLRSQLRAGPRPLDLWCVIYNDQLDWPVQDFLDLCDTITFWHINGDYLKDLEANFQKFEKMTPGKDRVLGIYMWDYGGGKPWGRPTPIDVLKWQCDLGLQWLRQGRITGIIVLASCICDIDLETVEWTRQWIAEVGDQRLEISKSGGDGSSSNRSSPR